MASRALHSVSLFSNCGAGDVGFAKAGFQFDVMAEIDPRRLQVCLLNHPKAVGVEGDLRKTWTEVVSTYRRRARNCRLSLLAACPPCQGMSTARSDRGKEADADAGMSDNRNLLVTVIANVANSLLPRMIVVENVQAFLTKKVRHPRTNKPISAARLLIDELASSYDVFPFLTDMSWYGVPQSRRRSFLTFVNRKEQCANELIERNKVPFPLRTHGVDSPQNTITVREALQDMGLPKLDAKSQRSAISGGYKGLHAVPVWSKTQYSMVAAIPKNSGKSAWENQKCEKCGPVDVDPEDAICPWCEGPLLRPVVELENGSFRLVNGFKNSTYRRMKSSAPAATITTATGHIGSNNTIHPFQNRLLSTLECALLQSLPRSFKWGDALEKWGHTNIRAMVGEAVPPLFTFKHGRVLRALLEKRYQVRMLGVDANEHERALKKLGLLKFDNS